MTAPAGGGRLARRAAARARRRRRLVRVAAVAAAVGVVGLLAAVALRVVATDRGAPPPTEAPAQPDPAGAHTLLLARVPDDGGPALGVTLLAASGDRSPGSGPASLLFLPVGTLVDVPGHGLDRLGLAHQYGGAPLLRATVENLLGIGLDHVAVVAESDLSAWLSRAGRLRVDVARRLVARDAEGTPTLRFAAGSQVLDGRRLAEYWAFAEPGEEELATFPRQQAVWQTLLGAVADDRTLRDVLLRGGPPQLRTDADRPWLDRLLAALAAAHARGELAASPLPVEPFGGAGPDGGATYRVREDERVRFVRTHLAASVPAGFEEPLRVEVLNGVGRPGVGQQVGRILSGQGFRIVRSDNARSFDFAETTILVYAEDPEALAAARRLRSLLGVGSIKVSRRPQSVVDVTIVVGADLTDAEGRQR